MRRIPRQRDPPVPIIPRNSRPLPDTIAPDPITAIRCSDKSTPKRFGEFGTPVIPNLADLTWRGDGGVCSGVAPCEAEHPAVG